jgi:NADH dehydrogenase [ubiquinone] 1 alpha subcomplex assembly factor 7
LKTEASAKGLADPAPLEARLAELIRAAGPIDIGTFMTLALGHPTLGYYRRDVRLGADGDFVTSPELSQIFGELIGLGLAAAWQAADGPPAHLVELGPGNGTLMADLWRATKSVPGWHDALDVHLVETSERLRRRQQDRLAAIERAEWHERLETLPTDRPLLVIANELFDALPIRQLILEDDGWHEVRVDLDADGRLCLGRTDELSALSGGLSRETPITEAVVGSVIELSPAREAMMEELALRLCDQGGIALIIDYGELEPTPGSTLQAVSGHRKVGPLTRPGEVDLSSRVAFGPLARAAKAQGATVYGPVPQGLFLARLGADLRLQQLVRRASPATAQRLQAGHQRLTAPDAMGELFKSLAVCKWPVVPPGFVPEEVLR